MNLQIKCFKLNKKIEQISVVIHILLAKLTYIVCILPDISVTAINYFILNLNDESFQLAIPVL